VKVLVIGATGTIGKAVVNALVARHQVVSAGHRQGEFRVDLAELASIENLFGSVGHVDAVVSAAGAARSVPFADLTDQDLRVGLLNKLLGQINLTRGCRKGSPERGLGDAHRRPGEPPFRARYRASLRRERRSGSICPRSSAGDAAWYSTQRCESRLGARDAAGVRHGLISRHTGGRSRSRLCAKC